MKETNNNYNKIMKKKNKVKKIKEIIKTNSLRKSEEKGNQRKDMKKGLTHSVLGKYETK
jgi:hypothetical protein